jgi:biotin/methionine sulfoxide reductase
MRSARVPHSSHWGAFEAEVADGAVVAIRPYRHDPDPSPLLGNSVDCLSHRAWITQPVVRAGWLDRGPGPDARRSIGRTNAVPSAPSERSQH